MDVEETILWERTDEPGHESARLRRSGTEIFLEGSAVFDHEGAPCRLDYVVVADHRFHTRRGAVEGWLGERTLSIEVEVREGRWRLNGRECSEVDGAVDLDLNFSPSTNLLPIRRLGLEVGQEAKVRSAWLRFPEFDLKPLDQTYRRVSESRYSYRSDGGFEAELEVSPAGFVSVYPGIARNISRLDGGRADG
jgi:hypothetical protein